MMMMMMMTTVTDWIFSWEVFNIFCCNVIPAVLLYFCSSREAVVRVACLWCIGLGGGKRRRQGGILTMTESMVFDVFAVVNVIPAVRYFFSSRKALDCVGCPWCIGLGGRNGRARGRGLCRWGNRRATFFYLLLSSFRVVIRWHPAGDIIPYHTPRWSIGKARLLHARRGCQHHAQLYLVYIPFVNALGETFCSIVALSTLALFSAVCVEYIFDISHPFQGGGVCILSHERRTGMCGAVFVFVLWGKKKEERASVPFCSAFSSSKNVFFCGGEERGSSRGRWREPSREYESGLRCFIRVVRVLAIYSSIHVWTITYIYSVV